MKPRRVKFIDACSKCLTLVTRWYADDNVMIDDEDDNDPIQPFLVKRIKGHCRNFKCGHMNYITIKCIRSDKMDDVFHWEAIREN